MVVFQGPADSGCLLPLSVAAILLSTAHFPGQEADTAMIASAVMHKLLCFVQQGVSLAVRLAGRDSPVPVVQCIR